MSMRAMMDLRDMLCRELEEISGKGELTAGALETVHKLTDTIKNIDKIGMLEEEEGYSRAGDWEARGRFGHPHDDGHSYARRGRHYVRGHYSRDEGRHEMMAQLETMMGSAQGRDREVIRRAMDELRQA